MKTGSTSVEAYFERFCMPENDYELSHDREVYESNFGVVGYRGPKPSSQKKWYNHMSAYEVKQKLGDAKWDSYYKFCIVRNPWDKAVSAYDHFGESFANKFKKKMWLNKLSKKIRLKIRHPFYTTTQDDFLAWLTYGKLPIDRDIYQIKNKTIIDDVIRFENLNDDIYKICQRLRLPWDPSLLPHLKTEIRNRSVPLEAVYSPAADKIIRDRYASEIAEFGYTPPCKFGVKFCSRQL